MSELELVPALDNRVARRRDAATPFVLHDQRTFLVAGPLGTLDARTSSPDEGLFHDDVRHLHWLELAIDGVEPEVAHTELSEDGKHLHLELVVLARRGTRRAARTLWIEDGCLHDRVEVWGPPAEVRWRFATDFADIFELRGAKRTRRGRVRTPEPHAHGFDVAYDGLDGWRRTTSLHVDAPVRLGERTMAASLRPSAGTPASVRLRICCEHDGERAAPPPRVLGDLEDVALSVEGVAERWITRSLHDLTMLTRRTEHGPLPLAGLPWFASPFGRDAIWTSLMTLWIQPGIAEGVLRFLAASQSDGSDPGHAAEPGKIVHELRSSEMARLDDVPFGRSYSTADATPLFVVLLDRTVQRTGDDALLHELWPAAERALGWLDRTCEAHPHGLASYRGGAGIAHQSWKDSTDALPFDTSPFAERITTVELAGYAIAAQRAGARLARRLGLDAEVDRRRARAGRAERALERMWDAALGTYVLAVDEHDGRCAVRGSNVGHLLFFGAVPNERAGAVRDALMHPASFAGWGIRTLDAREPAYDPLSYHRGSIWPHDTCIAAMGLRRYGFVEDAVRIAEGLARAARGFDHHRLPELFGGVAADESHEPLPYPGACAPQAWAAAVPFGLLGACLGADVDGANRRVTVRDARLFDGVGRLAVDRLPLRDGPARLELERGRDGRALVRASAEGDVDVRFRPHDGLHDGEAP